MRFLDRQILARLLKLFDFTSMGALFAVSVFIVSSGIEISEFSQVLGMRIKVQNVLLFAGFMWAWHYTFSIFGLYRSRRLSAKYSELIDICKATSLGVLVLAFAGTLFNLYLLTPQFLLFFWVFSTGYTLLSRLTLRYFLKQARIRSRNLRHILIVGTNARVVKFAKHIETSTEQGFRLIGFVDQDISSQEFQENGFVLVSDLKSIKDFIRHNVIDEVVIGLPLKSFYVEASEILSWCQEQGITVRFLSDIFDVSQNQSMASAEHIEDAAVITFSNGRMYGPSVVAKRLTDILVSAGLIVLLSPLLVAVSVVIRITSPGPVFFAQERIGLNKRRFRLYKFRTMMPDAEKRIAELEHLNEMDGPAFKIKNDPRITPVGKFLRKASIDELPQLINVLKGDISLVGPRPLPLRDYMGFSLDWHRRRFSVRPGITCLWQVSGRNGVPFSEWMDLDMQYIDKWSLWLDLKIILKTIPAVLKGAGAS